MTTRHKLKVRGMVLPMLLLVSQTLRAQDIPDRINYQKFNTIYLDKKKISDAKRAEADQKLADYRSKTALRVQSEQNLVKINSDISSAQQTIVNRNQQIDTTTAAISDLDNRFAQNGLGMQQAQAEMVRLDDQIFAARIAIGEQQTRVKDARSSRDSATTDLRNAENLLNQAKQRLIDATARRDSLSREIDQLVIETATLRSESGSLDAAINRDEQLARDMDAQRSNIIRTLQTLATKLDSARRNETTVRSSLTTERQNLSQLEARINDLTSRIQSEEREKQRKIEERSRLDAQMQPLLQNIRDLEMALRQPDLSIEEIARLQGELLQKKSEFDRLGAALAANENGITAADNAIRGLENDRRPVETQRQTSAQKVASFEVMLVNATAEVDSTQQQITANETKRDELTRHLNILNNQLDVSRNRYRLVTNDLLPTKERRLADNRALYQTASNDESTIGLERDRLQQQVNERSAAVSRAEQSVRDVEKELDTRQRNQDGLVAQRDRANARRQQLQDDNAFIQVQIDKNRSDVTAFERDIVTLNAKIAGLRSSIPAAEADIASSRDIESRAKGVFDAADAVAKTFEKDTTDAKALYEKVLAQYNLEKANATVAGRDQGAPAGQKESEERASALATTDGNRDGDQAGGGKGRDDGADRDYRAGKAAGLDRGLKEGGAIGQQEGTDVGTRDGQAKGTADGLVQGYQNGLARGKQDGYAKGVADGRSQQNYDLGHEAGLVAGEKRANTTARAEDYPKGKAAALAAIRASKPAQVITIDNRDVTSTKLDQFISAQVRSGLKIQGKLGQLKLVSSEGLTKAAPDPDFRYRVYQDRYDHPDFVAVYRTAYDASYVAKFKEVYQLKYNEMYKAVYDQAYKAAYAKAFAQSYPDSYRVGDAEGYESGYKTGYATERAKAYKIAYDATYAAARNVALTVRYQEGYDFGYQDGYGLGQRDGGDAIFKEGYAVGEPEGFEDRIADARQEAYAQGDAEVRADYANNYKVELLGADLVDTNNDGVFSPTEFAALSVKLRNFGGKEVSAKKLNVSVESLTPAFELTGSAALKALPANTEADFTQVLRGRVVGSNEGVNIQLRVTVKDENTVVGTFVVEKKIATFVKVAGFAANITVSNPNQLWQAFVDISNGGKTVASNVWVRIRSRDPNIVTTSEWIQLGHLQPGAAVRATFTVRALAYADYSKNVFDITVRDSNNVTYLQAGYLVPIRQVF